MNCQEILTVLQLYRALTIETLGLDPAADITVTSAYSFIIVSSTNDLNIQFIVSNNSTKLESLYPADENIKKKIESVQWPTLSSRSDYQFPAHITKRLDTADSIASLAVNCTRGDDYAPGNFSKIILGNKHIELQQINYMNAKSLDHKNNYSLRSLVFRISFDEKEKMITEFNDRSSDNNRHCGDKIQAALDWLPE